MNKRTNVRFSRSTSLDVQRAKNNFIQNFIMPLLQFCLNPTMFLMMMLHVKLMRNKTASLNR